MRHPSILLRTLLFGLLACASLPAQVTFLPGSAPVDELRRLYQQAGLAFPVAGFPVSGATLAGYAAGLAGRLAEPGLEAALESYLSGLDYRPGRVDIAIRNRFSIEGYLRSGNPWVEFHRDYLEREPLWELTMAWSRADRAAFVIQGFLRREYQGAADWNLPGSSPSNPVALENQQVSRGYFWYNFDPLQLELGRDAVHFGPLRSSLLPSDRLPWMDMLRLTLPLGRLTMDLMVSSLESIRASGGDVDDSLTLEEGYVFGETIILANLHRFEYDFGAWRAAVSGLAVYARPGNYFSLVDFFPVFSWHATAIKPYNISLIFDLEAALFPGFRVMAQLGFDDISTEGIGVSDATIPTISAGIAGVEYVRPLGFAGLALYAEAGYTHYLWGSYNDKWAMARAIYRLDLDRVNQALPLTSPYGPGTAWLLAEAALEEWRGFTVRLFTELVFRKPGVSLTGTTYRTSPALEGAAMEGTVSIGGEVRFRHRGWLEAYARPTWLHRESGGWLELVLGATADLDWRRAVSLPAAPAEGGAEARAPGR